MIAKFSYRKRSEDQRREACFRCHAVGLTLKIAVGVSLLRSQPIRASQSRSRFCVMENGNYFIHIKQYMLMSDIYNTIPYIY